MDTTKKTEDIELSVVILCYKGGAYIRNFSDHVVRILKSSAPSWEVVLVGNYHEHSGDPTPGIVRELASAEPRVKAVAVPKEGMMGWDARCGLKAAEGRYLCLLDGDEQMPPEDIIKVYDKIKTDNLDFVKTYRVKRYDGWLRTVNSWIYNAVFRILFPGTGVRDVNSKPKIFTRALYDKMKLSSDDWFLDAEMIIRCRRLKRGIGEIPAIFYKNPSRKSYVKISAILEFVRNLLRARIKEFLNKEPQ